MVNVMKGVGVHPLPPPGQANFTLMTECTPESSRYYSVYSVVTGMGEGHYTQTICIYVHFVRSQVTELIEGSLEDEAA